MRIGKRQQGKARLRIGAASFLPRHMWASCRELSRFVVDAEARGNGEGSALLKKVCAEADKEHTSLIIAIDAGENESRLVEFYRRFGFDIWQAKPVLMARRPSD